MYSLTLQNAGGNSIVTSGDILGRLSYAVPSESDGAAATYVVSQIYSVAEGSFTSASNPAGLLFATSSADSAPATGRIKISSDGHFIPLASGTYDLGSPSLPFRNLYINSGNINYLNINSQYAFPTSTGSVGDSLVYAGSNQVAWSGVSAALSGQLDGNLDLNNYDIVGTGNITIDGNVTAEYFYGDLDGVVITECRNDTGSTIAEGTPVYVAGYYSSNGKPLVAPADCANATKMPAIGLLASELTTGSEGHVHVFGLAQNLPSGVTNGFSVGNTVYVDNGGGLTNVRPTGVSELVQNIGRVLKTGTNGRILVLGPGRSNDVPNSGHFEQLTVDGYTALAVDNGNVGIGTASPSEKLDVRYPTSGGMALIKDSDSNDGLLFGDMAYSFDNAYQGIKHIEMTGDKDYMMISEGRNTLVSARSDGSLYLRGGGSFWENEIRIYPDTGGVVVNEGGANSDFRVEGDTDQNLIRTDASADRVGVGTSSLNGKFNVYQTTENQSYQYGSYVSANHYTTTGGTNFVFGSYTDVRKHVASGVTDTGYVMGHECNALLSDEGSLASAFGLRTYAGINAQSDNGNLTAAYGIQSRVINLSQGTGNINTARGIDVYINGDLGSVGNGGITNAYGVYIQSILNSTNTYGLYQVGSSDKNYFAGDVGIGTTSPLSKLHVRDTTDSDCQIVVDNGTARAKLQTLSNIGYAGTITDHDFILRSNNIDGIKLSNSASNNIVVVNPTANDQDFRVRGSSETNLIYVDASTNNVGIGIGAPTQRLHVYEAGNAQVLVDDGTVKTKVQSLAGQSKGIVGTNSNHDLEFRTNNNGKMIIKAGGDVGIGTASPSYKLDVAGSGSFDALNINDQFTFPTTDGSAGQSLVTDGAGNVAWSGVSGGGGSTSLGTLSVTSSQSLFNTTDIYPSGGLAVFLNGVKLVEGTDFEETSNTSFTLTSPAASGDIVEYVAYGSTIASTNLQKTGDTMTGNLTVNADLIVKGYKETHVDNGNTGTSQTIAITNSTLQTYTLNDNCTFTMPTADAGRSFTIFLKTGTGSFTATFTGVKWPAGSAPTITTTASRMDILTFYSDGTNWYGNLVQEYTP